MDMQKRDSVERSASIDKDIHPAPSPFTNIRPLKDVFEKRRIFSKRELAKIEVYSIIRPESRLPVYA